MRIFYTILAGISISSILGCATSNQHAALSSSQFTFSAIESQWKATNSANGAVVLFATARPTSPAELVFGNPMVTMAPGYVVFIDAKMKTPTFLFYRTFRFLQMPPGKHSIQFGGNDLFTKAEQLHITLKAGQIAFIDGSSMKSPSIVSDSDGKLAVKSLRFRSDPSEWEPFGNLR